MDGADLAIRLRRATFNSALAAGDLTDAVLVAGTDSALITGRKAQLQAWKREFAAPDRTIYTRLPKSIETSPVAPIALEHGEWQGITKAGAFVASGTYTAKWRKIGEDWMIEAEIYLTLA